MLSGFGRTAVRLLPNSSHRVGSAPLLCPRVSAILIGSSPTYIPPCISLQRKFATKPVSRPKAHTGRTASSPRKAKPATKPRSTKPTSDDATQEEVKPKSKAGLKPKSKLKSQPKTKTKTKTKAKPRKTRVAKKPQTEEQKTAAAEKAKRVQIRLLRKAALKPPTLPPATGWQVLNAELLKSGKGTMKDSAETYKNLTPEEREHYNHIANQNRAEAAKIYRDWIESQPVHDIERANTARNHLKRLGIKGFLKLHDARHIKKPIPAQMRFSSERHQSGDYQGLTFAEKAQLIKKEFDELPQGERQKYFDLAAQDKKKYSEAKAAQIA